MSEMPNFAAQPEQSNSATVARVNVAAIEKELENLWKREPDSDGKAGATTLIRACAFNLILFSTAPDAEQVGNDLLDEVLLHHPCRGILAVFQPNQPHSLSAWVSARCHIAGVNRQICSEQITISASGAKVQELSSVVTPLVLPDLPVFLWWRHDHIDEDTFLPLMECSSRLLVDSSLAAMDPHFLAEVSRLIQRNRKCLLVSDLNWRRLHGWCRSIADAFDGFPMHPEDLAHIRKVKIETYNPDKEKGISAAALLLTGWLASRLQWEPISLAENEAQFLARDGRVDVCMVDSARKLEDKPRPGCLCDVLFEFDHERKLLVTLEQFEEQSFVHARTSDSHEKESTRTDNNASEAELVGMEVEILSHDPIYEGAMEVLAKLLETGEAKWTV